MNTAEYYTIRCTSCGRRNRIPASRAREQGKCGQCKAVLNTEDLFTTTPMMVTDADFDQKVLKAPLPVLLDCWAPWCGPCKMMGPVFDQLAAEWRGRIRVCKLNVDENPQTAARFQTQSIPTMLVFDNGQLKDTMIGAMPKHQIVQKMAAFL